MMSPELAAMPSPTLSPDPLSASPSQALCPELEEAWMELLSLPELQVCCDSKCGTEYTGRILQRMHR